MRKLYKTLFCLFGGVTGAAVAFLLMDILERYFDVKVSALLSAGNIGLIIVGASLLCAVLFLLAYDRLSKALVSTMRRFEMRVAAVPTKDLVLGTIGLFGGLALAFLVGQVVALLQSPLLTMAVNFLLYIILGSLGARIALSRRTEVQLSVIKRRMDKYSDAEPFVLVDTSVIIDGRILDLCKTGFISQTLVIPSFVLAELRRVADSEDEQKRARGRRGLDTLAELREIPNLSVHLDETEFPGADTAQRLLGMAAEREAPILTIDYALEKTAALTGVRILNINELANAVKTVLLPGDELTVLVQKEGREQGQGLAYLEDGTMIVVENGRGALHTQVRVLVTSVLQTNAGRMIFARLKDK